jgi:hypothetical protein
MRTCDGSRSVVAQFENGRTSPIVGIERFRTPTGQSKWWQALVPADYSATLGVIPTDL